MTAAPKQRGNDHQSDHGEKHQQADLPLGWRVVEDAEGRATILHVRDVEDALDDGDAVVQGDVRRNHTLGVAIEQQHDKCNQEVVGAHDSATRHFDQLLAISQLALSETTLIRVKAYEANINSMRASRHPSLFRSEPPSTVRTRSGTPCLLRREPNGSSSV